jgi:hypothetical protein
MTYSHTELVYSILDQESIARGHTAYYLKWTDESLADGGEAYYRAGKTTVDLLPPEAQALRKTAIDMSRKAGGLFAKFDFVNATYAAQAAFRAAAAYRDLARPRCRHDGARARHEEDRCRGVRLGDGLAGRPDTTHERGPPRAGLSRSMLPPAAATAHRRERRRCGYWTWTSPPSTGPQLKYVSAPARSTQRLSRSSPSAWPSPSSVTVTAKSPCSLGPTAGFVRYVPPN